MANATLPEILKKLGDDKWVMAELSPDEAQILGEDLEAFHGALRKAKYSIHQVLGLKGEEAKQGIINHLKRYLNSTTTPKQTP